MAVNDSHGYSMSLVCSWNEVGMSYVKFPQAPFARAPFGECRGLTKRVLSKRAVLADVPPERKPERGYIRMFPRNENRNEGTFACSPGTKTGASVRSPKPPFYETALLSSSDRFEP